MSPVSRCVALTLLAALSLAAGACDSKKPAPTGTSGAAPHGTGAAPAAKLHVGFAQIGAESDWRKANTDSIRSEASTRKIELDLVDAQQKQENQIKAIRTFIAKKVDVIAFAPVVETGWEPVLKEVKEAGIPVLLTDRLVDVSDPSLFLTFIGADFVDEGRRAAEWLATATGGNSKIVELQGTPGAAPAINRKKGFEEGIKAHPGMQIIKSQSAEFNRAKGREVMESILKSPDGKQLTAVFAHNDDMALGAIQALEEAGMKPGTDVKVVSIDGIKAAFEAMVAGKLNCTVECNPMLGAQLFDAIQAVRDGKTIERRIVTPARVFDQSGAAGELPNRKY
jgi:simple sugar transport system substrate-binding protein